MVPGFFVSASMRAMLSLLLAFCVSAFAATPAASEEPVFRVRLSEDLGTLDWNHGEVNPEIQYQLMEGLFRADAKGKAVPAAAKSLFWGKDKKSLRILLDPLSRWSDGAPVCAQGFVDSWTRLKDPKFASPYAHYANIVKSVEAISCRELKITFTRASPEAPALFSHYVFFPLRAEPLAKDPALFRSGKGLLVNGPYVVEEWKKNQRLVLSANPRYGKAAPKVKKLEFYFVPDDGTAQVLFEQSKLDWMKDIPALLRTPALEKGPTFRQFPSYTSFYFGVNATRATLAQDPVIRRALNEALAREELPKVLGREHRPARTWLPPTLSSDVKALPADGAVLAVAREKLVKAAAEGKMDLSLRVYNKSAHRLLAEWAQGQWEKKLGVRIPIEVQEAKAYWKELSTNPPPLFLSGITAPYAHPRAYLQEFLGGSTANWTGWTDEAYDRAVNDGDFAEAETLLEKAGYVIPLYTRDAVALVQKKWKSFSINPLGQAFLAELP
jgi:oligopeptide transport system substrate-binding protein